MVLYHTVNHMSADMAQHSLCNLNTNWDPIVVIQREAWEINYIPEGITGPVHEVEITQLIHHQNVT
jgi:hypothetical protein